MQVNELVPETGGERSIVRLAEQNHSWKQRCTEGEDDLCTVHVGCATYKGANPI